jgi:chorismate synthase
VQILSGVSEGRTTGAPIALLVQNVDQRSKDYSEIAASFRPGHADCTDLPNYAFRACRG